jgi:hypothetical protein
MLQKNPRTRIRKAIQKGPMFQYGAPECGKTFVSKANLIQHYSPDHPGEKRNRSLIPQRQMFQTVVFGGEQEMMAQRQRPSDEANQQLPSEGKGVCKYGKAKREDP